MNANKMNANKGKTALITGASGGIGLELAKVFAANNYNLVLVARSERTLQEIGQQLSASHGISVKVLAKDLSQSSAPDEILTSMTEEAIAVDVLVNNAGFGLYGYFAENDWSKEQQMIQLNITALTHLTKLFLPQMIERGNGKILNLSSTGAFQPGPLMAIYYCTKVYILHFSEAIANELKGTGVTVTALCPGATQTGFHNAAESGSARLFRGGMMDAEKVARIGYQGLMKGKTVVIPGTRNQILALAPRFAPRNMTTRIVRFLQESTDAQIH